MGFMDIFMDVNGVYRVPLCSFFRSQSSRSPGVRLAECGKVRLGGDLTETAFDPFGMGIKKNWDFHGG